MSSGETIQAATALARVTDPQPLQIERPKSIDVTTQSSRHYDETWTGSVEYIGCYHKGDLTIEGGLDHWAGSAPSEFKQDMFWMDLDEALFAATDKHLRDWNIDTPGSHSRTVKIRLMVEMQWIDDYHGEGWEVEESFVKSNLPPNIHALIEKWWNRQVEVIQVEANP